MPSRLRRLLACSVLLLTAAPLAATATPPAAGAAQPAQARDDRVAPVLGRDAPGRIKGVYIVVLRDRTGPAKARQARQAAVRKGGTVLMRYRTAIKGFAARLPAPAVKALRRNPAVAYIEADGRARTAGERVDPVWGLDRIDQPERPLDGFFRFDQTGVGVTAYVVDTGIRSDHSAFGDRVTGGFTSVKDGEGSEDCNGHGTHVAGTVGGRRYGVAPAVSLVPVRVLDCAGFGSWRQIIRGVDFVARHHARNPGPAVANMSLSGGRGGESKALRDAIVATTDGDGTAPGVIFAIAAGNWSDVACRAAPAHVRKALVVGATNPWDKRADFSNYGKCLDLFAPGVRVESAGIRTRWATETYSGTSMASPHVAGVAALLLEAAPTATPAEVHRAVVDNATPGVVRSKGPLSPNRLLYSGFLAPAG